MEIGVRELRNRTADVIERVRHGESVTLTVNRTPVADIVPHARRPRAIPAARVLAIRERHGADPDLFATLDELAGATVDELWPPSD
ncbi:MAG TPA: type II toxin-antitoxin system prevent-host-death family antitoxin [Solirubrobacterales bacterium]|nr:type II toxin-antitoxin system prevent-host-death family antitoxin [Solirubrobacterales bacterium]